MKSKIILIDVGYLTHKSIYHYNKMVLLKEELIENGDQEKADALFIAPSTYTFMSSLISCLKKVGINDECSDKVILAADGRHSWRKDADLNYKGNRKDKRDEAVGVDWSKEYEAHNNLLEKIEDNLPFFVVKSHGIEADDWIAYATRYFKDNLCVIVSVDADFDQLLVADNVRIFSNHPKRKLCPYKILDLDRAKEKKKAYNSLMGKIRKEASDNLISEVLTEEDYDNRKQIVTLLELPQYVIDKMLPALEEIAPLVKEYFYPEAFGVGICKKLLTLYDQDKIISYDSCRVKFEKKLIKKRKEDVKKKNEKKLGKLLHV